MNRSKHLAVTFLLLFFFVTLHAQTDKEFWFAAPDLSTAHCDSIIFLKFTTLDQGATVTVSQPANPAFTPIQLEIPAGQTSSVDLFPYKSSVECSPANTVNNCGLHITSTQWIQASYELSCNNLEIFPLKGRNAVGLDFLIPIQKFFNNGPSLTPAPVSSFTIVALEDNTQVTIIPSNDIVGHPAGQSFTVTLNRGQAYSAVAVSILASAHLGGSFVTSDKPITVTIADDSSVTTWGTCLDLLGDQLVPVTKIGQDYVIVKGFLPSNRDRIHVYATTDNTSIYLNGNASPVTTIDRGEYYTNTVVGPSLFIHTSEPAYVTHISGFGCELADAVVPPLECTGSYSVAFYHPTISNYYGFVIVPAGGEGNFTVGGSTSILTSALFAAVPGTGGQWLAAQVNLTNVLGQSIQVQNSTHKFLMGFLGGSTSGSSYGYFTDYGPFRLDLGEDTTLCPNSTLLLSSGYPNCTYEWQDGSSNPFFLVSAPGDYYLTVTDPQGCTDTTSIKIRYFDAGSVTWDENFEPHCVTDPPFPLSGGTPEGGTYSGMGVIGNTFSPAVGAGTYYLSYTAIDANGCTQSDNNSLTVNFLPLVYFTNSLQDQCVTDTEYYLSGGFPPGGTYSGPGVDGANFNAAAAGSGTHWITYTYTDDNGCTNSFENFITVHDLPIVTFDVPLDPQCVSFDMYLLTGGSPLGGTYSGPGVSGFIFNASLAGVGTHKIYYSYSDIFGCIGVDSNTIVVYPLPPVSWTTSYQPMCESAGSILLTGAIPAGGTFFGPGTFGNAFSPSVAGPGDHTITYFYMDTHGCSNTATSTITVYPLPDVSFDETFQDICQLVVPIELTSGLPAGGTYSGDGIVLNAFDPDLAGAGTHIITYTYTDINNCTSWDTNSITVLPVPQASAIAEPMVLCEGDTIFFTGAASGGSGEGFTFLWTGPGFVSTDTNPYLTNTLPINSGQYSLVVTDDNLCSSVNDAVVEVLVKPRPSAQAGVVDPEVCTGESIQLTSLVNGGSGSVYQYHWEGPSGFVSGEPNPLITAANVSDSGDYILVVTDDAGCGSAVADTVSVTVFPLPEIIGTTPAPEVCEGDTVYLFSNASGGSGGNYSYLWVGPAGFTSNEQNPVIQGIGAGFSGLFSVTVTDENLCTAADVPGFSLTVNPRPSLQTFVDDDSLCAGQSVTFSAIASGGSNTGYVFTWTGPASFSSSLSGPVINNVQSQNSGTYILRLTDSNGCKAYPDDSIYILVFPLPMAYSGTTTPELCVGGTIQLNGSAQGGTPPYSYSWTGPSGFTSAVQDPMISDAQQTHSGNYSLTVTDSQGCSSLNNAIVNILVYTNPGVNATASPAVVCEGSSFDLTANPSGGSGMGYSYQWTGPDNFTSALQGPITIVASLSSSGYYVVEIQDNFNCSSKDSVLVTVNPTPVASASSNSPVCAGSPLNLYCSPNGMTSYQWSGPGAFTSPQQNPVRSNALVTYSGTYIVTVTNSFNCEAVAAAEVVVNPLPVANAGPDQNVNYGVSVNLAGSASGCGGNCGFLWAPAGMINGTNTVSDPTTVNLTATQTYTLTVTNTLTGCSSLADAVTIYVSGSAIGVNPVAQPAIICSGESSTLQAQAGGGNLSYTYIWSPATGLSATNVANPLASPLVTTTYHVTVSDGFNQASGQVTLQVIAAPLVNAGPDTLICGCSPLTLSQSSVSFTASFAWISPGDGVFDDPNDLHPTYSPGPWDCQNGTFQLFLHGVGNTPCGDVYDTIVITISPLTIAYAGENDTICEGETYTLSHSVVTDAESVLWTTSGDGSYDDQTILHPVYTPGPNDIIAGSVTLTLNAENPFPQCADSSSFLVLTIKPLPVANAGSNVTICSGDSAQLQASGGGTYAWLPATGLSDDSISNPFAFPVITTVYTLTVTLEGCSASDQLTVTVRPLPALTISPDPHICPGDSTNIWANGASAWLWSTGATTNSIWVSPLVSTNYYVTGTDNFGCHSTAQITVIVDPVPVLSVDPQESDICRGEHVIITVQGAYYYSWSPQKGISNPYSYMVQAEPLQTTEYTITGTNLEGCKSTIKTFIRVLEKPELKLPDSSFLCLGDQMILNAGWNDGVDYQWQDGSQSQFYKVTEPGLYFVVASNPGCEVSDTVIIYPCAILWVPNAFTPDGDGLNEIFQIKTTTELLEYQIYIYSRKGELIYESDDVYSGWDGKFKDSMCGPGVFTWMIYYKSRDAGPQLMKGTVTLFR
ncbi:MAG: gliding motility-associated C-terminal domain-containing protein [Bacteroidales bacterium]